MDLVAALADDDGEGLIVAPLGLLWRFPFHALPVDGSVLGAVVPLTFSTPAARNVPAAREGTWMGHFDLSLPFAVSDLVGVLDAARRHQVRIELLDHFNDLTMSPAPSALFFSGHGVGLGASQHLRLVGQDRAGIAEIGPLAPGASCLIDACWTGAVIDALGTDPVDLPLSLLARGAHSVWAAVGPVADQRAATMLDVLLEHWRPGTSLAQASCMALRKLLGGDPELPLVECALRDDWTRALLCATIMSVVVRLTGESAAQAQHLVAQLVGDGLDVVPRAVSQQDRGIVVDVVVAFGVNAAYDLVKARVQHWVETRGADEHEVSLLPDDDADEPDDSRTHPAGPADS